MTEFPFEKGNKKGKILFKKGKPGGPGRPIGLRNKATIMLETIGQAQIDAAYHKMAQMIHTGDKDGSFNVCKFIIERTSPPDNARKIFLGKRNMRTAEGCAETAEEVTSMMNDGELSIDDALDVGKVIDQKLKLVLETDITKKIEDKLNGVEKR